MVLNENTTLFLFRIIYCFLKISILNILLLSLWLELVMLFLCYEFKLVVSPKKALQMGRWVYTIYWTNMVKIIHINHRRPPNIFSSLSTFFENKRDCMLICILNKEQKFSVQLLNMQSLLFSENVLKLDIMFGGLLWLIGWVFSDWKFLSQI